MTWFRVDDGWYSHPKVVGLSMAARGLWVSAGSWSGSHLTDGLVTREALKVLAGTPKLAAELVRAGLWKTCETGWKFHQWSERQPSRKDVEKVRELKRVRQARWRQKPEGSDADVDASQDGAVDASTRASRDASRDAPVEPAPARAFSRPDPVPSRSHASSDLRSADASSNDAAADLRLVSESAGPDPELQAASRGRQWLSQALPDVPDHRGKWAHAYAELSRMPEPQRLVAATTLAQEAQKPGQRRYLTPQHVLDYWAAYASGQTPRSFAAHGKAAAGSSARLAGMAVVGKPSDYRKDEPDPWA